MPPDLPHGTLPLSLLKSSGLCQVDAEAAAAARSRKLMEPPALILRRHRCATVVHSCRPILTSDKAKSELTVLARLNRPGFLLRFFVSACWNPAPSVGRRQSIQRYTVTVAAPCG